MATFIDDFCEVLYSRLIKIYSQMSLEGWTTDEILRVFKCIHTVLRDKTYADEYYSGQTYMTLVKSCEEFYDDDFKTIVPKYQQKNCVDPNCPRIQVINQVLFGGDIHDEGLSVGTFIQMNDMRIIYDLYSNSNLYSFAAKMTYLVKERYGTDENKAIYKKAEDLLSAKSPNA